MAHCELHTIIPGGAKEAFGNLLKLSRTPFLIADILHFTQPVPRSSWTIRAVELKQRRLVVALIVGHECLKRSVVLEKQQAVAPVNVGWPAVKKFAFLSIVVSFYPRCLVLT